MLQDQIIAEIKRIPSDKLAEVYDMIHYFRLGLMQDKVAESDKAQSSFSTRWRGRFKLAETTDDACLDYLKRTTATRRLKR